MKNYAIEIHIVNGTAYLMIRLSDSVNCLPAILTIELLMNWISYGLEYFFPDRFLFYFF
jgi:hypothetical protein